MLIISFFIFFIGKYYFSDEYKKKSYRTMNVIKKDINKDYLNIKTLKSDTDDIIETIANTSKKKRKFRFWELLKVN